MVPIIQLLNFMSYFHINLFNKKNQILNEFNCNSTKQRINKNLPEYYVEK